jgi:hypothetical protein
MRSSGSNKSNKASIQYADAALYLNGKLVTAEFTKQLRKAYLSIELREYMVKANKWSQPTLDKIWWEGFENAINTVTTDRKRFIQKFIHNKLPTNYRQHKYYEYKSSICRQCLNETETQDHILRCTACTNRMHIRKKYMLETNYQQITANTNIMNINQVFVVNV